MTPTKTNPALAGASNRGAGIKHFKSKHTAPTSPNQGVGLRLYAQLFCKPTAVSLNRESLPTPLQYLTERGLLIRRLKGEWALITCPSHKNGAEKNPSMSVNLTEGHFRCHACGAKGGDIIALHRLITGLGFRDALRELGGCHD